MYSLNNYKRFRQKMYKLINIKLNLNKDLGIPISVWNIYNDIHIKLTIHNQNT